MNFSSVTAKVFSYFVRGLLLIAPIYLTANILWSVLKGLDDQFAIIWPGTGLILVLLFVIVVGFLGSTFITVPLFRWFENWIKRLPLVRLIYFSLKDLFNAFVGDKKKFDKPVLLCLNKENHVYKLGFVTQDSVASLGVENEFVTVYCPHSYAFSGETFLVPSSSVKNMEGNTADIMKYIVSGGVSSNSE
jgi:uncharacterized membrane protein